MKIDINQNGVHCIISSEVIKVHMSGDRQKHNAALSGEQRRPPDLNHCAVTLKLNQTENAEHCESVLNAFVSTLYSMVEVNQVCSCVCDCIVSILNVRQLKLTISSLIF